MSNSRMPGATSRLTMAAGSLASAVRVPSAPVRVTPVTSCPRFRASVAILPPIIPVAPIKQNPHGMPPVVVAQDDIHRILVTSKIPWYPTETMRHGDAFEPNCPTRQVLDRIGAKWTVLVVLTLLDGPKRFTELRNTIRDVTPKVLTQTLRSMAQDGLVTRHVFAEVPPRVEYTLTPLGRTLQAPIQAITDWAENNVNEVMAAREAVLAD